MKNIYKVSWFDFSVTFEVDPTIFTKEVVEDFYGFWLHEYELDSYGERFNWTLKKLAWVCLLTQLNTQYAPKYVAEEVAKEEGFGILFGHGIYILDMGEVYFSLEDASVCEVKNVGE